MRDAPVGVGFAVPSSLVRKAVPSLKTGDAAQHAYLGISPSDGDDGVTVGTGAAARRDAREPPPARVGIATVIERRSRSLTAQRRRQMTARNYRTPLLALLMLTGALLIAGCGDSDNTTSSSKVEGNPTDRAFVAEMVPHHESAIEMAAVAEDEATSDFVKQLAADISRTQKAEIAQMKRVDSELADAGIAKGELAMNNHKMGMNMDAGSLRGAKPFDAKFIALMTPHHVGAVEMAKVEISKGDNAELKTLAQNIITAQEKEIAQMRDHAGASADTDTMDHSG